MGNLNRHNISELIKKHKIKHFIETGTGGGIGLTHALDFEFDTLSTIEIVPEIFKQALHQFRSHKRMLSFFCGTSEEYLSKAIKPIPLDEPILFWLDAHYPGADYQLAEYDDPTYEKIRTPLNKELEIIFSLRPNSMDVIIADDLRIYLNGNYEAGSLPTWAPKNNIEFRIPEDYTQIFDERDEGYLILEGKCL